MHFLSSWDMVRTLPNHSLVYTGPCIAYGPQVGTDAVLDCKLVPLEQGLNWKRLGVFCVCVNLLTLP